MFAGRFGHTQSKYKQQNDTKRILKLISFPCNLLRSLSNEREQSKHYTEKQVTCTINCPFPIQ